MKKFFGILFVLMLMLNTTFAMTFSQPVKIGKIENFTNNKVILENSYIVINGFRTTIDEYKKTHGTKIYGGYGERKKVSNNIVEYSQ